MNIKHITLLSLSIMSSAIINGISPKFENKIKNMSIDQLIEKKAQLQKKLETDVQPEFDKMKALIASECTEGRAYCLKCPEYRKQYHQIKAVRYVTQEKLNAVNTFICK